MTSIKANIETGEFRKGIRIFRRTSLPNKSANILLDRFETKILTILLETKKGRWGETSKEEINRDDENCNNVSQQFAAALFRVERRKEKYWNHPQVPRDVLV